MTVQDALFTRDAAYRAAYFFTLVFNC